MTVTQISRPVLPRATEPPPIRLGLAPVRGSGPVDCAWWPHGRDTATELRALVGELDARPPGHVTRVNIQRDGWDDIPIATSGTNADRPTAIVAAGRPDAEEAWDNEGGRGAGYRPMKETI